MKKEAGASLVISVFVFLIIGLMLINFVSAQNITISYPQEVEVNEEFTVSLKLIDFNKGTYDIKIDVLDPAGKRIAKIDNDNVWLSTYYYLKGAIDSDLEKDFKLKVVDTTSVGKIASIEVRTRDIGGNSKLFNSYKISISGIVETNENQKTGNENRETNEVNEGTSLSNEEETEEEGVTRVTSSSSAISEVTLLTTEEPNIEPKILQPIQLGKSNNLSSQEKRKLIDFSSLRNNKVLFSWIGLIFFCILIGILFLIRRKKEKEAII